MPFVTRLPALTGADPYPDALLALDFVGARRGPQYYKALGVTTADITKIPGWTYTGGASGGSYAAKADGSLQLFAQNVPRITDAGYWAEEARTNLLPRSQEFDNASWTQTNVSTLANQLAAPDGTTTADKLNETAATGVHSTYQDITKAASAIAYALCVYARSGERNSIELSLQSGASGAFTRVNLDTGSLIANSGYGAAAFTSVSTTITAAPNGFWRVCLMATTDTSTTLRSVVGNYFGSSSYAGTAGSGIYIWQADLQAGAFATSPIPTTSVAVTRAADVGYLPLTGPTDGTILVQGSTYQLTGSPLLLGHSSADTSGIYVSNAAGGIYNHWNGTANIGNTGVAVVTPSYKSVAIAYTGTSSRSMSAGGSAVTTSATTIGTVNRIAVGTPATLTNTAQSAQGPIRRIVIYPRAFANSELQAITTAGAY